MRFCKTIQDGILEAESGKLNLKRLELSLKVQHVFPEADAGKLISLIRRKACILSISLPIDSLFKLAIITQLINISLKVQCHIAASLSCVLEQDTLIPA